MMRVPHTESRVVRFIARRMAPFIQLFALYVVAHGEDGPGGGFQGGVIFASAFILIALVEGWREGRDALPEPVSDFLLPTGAMVYAGIGLLCLLLGGAFLQYEALALGNEHAKHAAHHFGLIGIEIGVTITVAGAMATLFFEMARPKLHLGPPPPRRRRRRKSAAPGMREAPGPEVA